MASKIFRSVGQTALLSMPL